VSPVARVLACVAALLLLGAGAVRADDAGAQPEHAAALLAKYATLKEELRHNKFNRPLAMRSHEGADGVTGEIHALLAYPFAIAAPALTEPAQWCEILILHLNTKYCRPATDGQPAILHVVVGKKYDQPIDEAYRVDFSYRVAARTANYLQVNLDADEGPMGTRDYRIVVEAVPTQDGRTFFRLSYSYSFGPVARLAMQLYLATVGRDKVGFTVVGKATDDEPRYIGGMRGAVERNTMRYYLAIEAYLGALSSPATARLERSLRDWFAASEGYARQLHEMERDEYLAMKHKEHARQKIAMARAQAQPSAR